MQNLYKIIFHTPNADGSLTAVEVKGGICQAQENGTVIIYKGNDPSYTEIAARVPKGVILLVEAVETKAEPKDRPVDIKKAKLIEEVLTYIKDKDYAYCLHQKAPKQVFEDTVLEVCKALGVWDTDI